MGQSSPISAMNARTNNVSNFVLFWQSVYEVSAAELCRFRRKRDRQKQYKRCVPEYHVATIIKCVADISVRSIYTKMQTRHRASTSMYSLTFRVRVTTPPKYGRNGTAHAAGASMFSPTRGVFAGMRSVRVRQCVRRAVGLADYRWALPRISIVLP